MGILSARERKPVRAVVHIEVYQRPSDGPEQSPLIPVNNPYPLPISHNILNVAWKSHMCDEVQFQVPSGKRQGAIYPQVSICVKESSS